MAELNLKTTAKTIELCKEKHPETWGKIKDKLSFENDELNKWEKIRENIYDEYYDEELKIYATDEVFSRRIPVNPHQLKVPNKMLRFTMPSYDTLLQHQIVKQPSIILLTYLLPDRFSREEKLANWNFYEAKTIHDSSLSQNTHSIMASELGFKKKAYEYFKKNANLDLDKSRDTDLGLHSACIGGTWQTIVNGFAGMRLRNGILDFAPSIPDEWTLFEFKIHYKDNIFRFRIDKNSISVEACSSHSSGEITIYEQPVELEKGMERIFKCQQ
jgi:trehalose/maltose hydrolase-like predicted phosphorylase